MDSCHSATWLPHIPGDEKKLGWEFHFLNMYAQLGIAS